MLLLCVLIVKFFSCENGYVNKKIGMSKIDMHALALTIWKIGISIWSIPFVGLYCIFLWYTTIVKLKLIYEDT